MTRPQRQLEQETKSSLPPEVSLEQEIATVKNGSKGGLVLAQTSGALKTMLKDRNDVFVIYDKDLGAGVGEENLMQDFYLETLAKNIEEPMNNDAIKFIAFPFSINEFHQIAIIIDKQNNQLISIDSLGIDRSKDSIIRQLINKINPQINQSSQKISKSANGNSESNYKNQANTADSWECGVHSVYNILDRVSNKHNQTNKPKVSLELDNNLRQIIIASREYQKIEEQLQFQRQANRTNKSKILATIESLRNSQTDPQEDLRILADALQIEQWAHFKEEKLLILKQNLIQEDL